jgi:hypothetical protein
MMTHIRLIIAAALFAGAAVYAADDGTIILNGSIKTMVGQVEVSSSGSGKWRAARAGMMVKMGWDVRTYIESSADIEFETGTVIRVGENSVITLSRMMLDKRVNVTSSSVKVATGKVWANVKKLANSKSNFEFETPTAVASIRGTRLGINVDKAGTQIDVYEGLVMVKPRGAGREVAVSTRNRAVVGTGNQAIRLVSFAADKDTVKGMPPMKDPFKDTTGAQNINALVDSTKLAAVADSTKLTAVVDSSKVPTAADSTKVHAAVDSSKLAPLRLDVVSPASGASVKETPALVKGKAGKDASVEVGGKEVVLERDGSFSSLVDLVLGKNTITVTARRGGLVKTVDLKIDYHPALNLNVTNIIDNMEVSSREITVDVEVNEGAKFSVNGKEGQTKVVLAPGKNVVSVRAWDQWNTVIEKTFAVNYAKTGVFTLKVVTPSRRCVNP